VDKRGREVVLRNVERIETADSEALDLDLPLTLGITQRDIGHINETMETLTE
jgi:hypothetical protein